VLASTVEHFGRLDILVNGAAGNFLASPEDLTPKGFRTGASLHHIILVTRESLFGPIVPFENNSCMPCKLEVMWPY
jgi:NAD(P)-dependent dehydrogenase (short-subunit alcohol dehydrogenase family)